MKRPVDSPPLRTPLTPVRVAAGWQLAPHSPFFKNSAVKRTLPSTPGEKDAEKERLEVELETATRALCDLNSRMVETKIEHAQALSDQAKASRDIAVELVRGATERQASYFSACTSR